MSCACPGLRLYLAFWMVDLVGWPPATSIKMTETVTLWYLKQWIVTQYLHRQLHKRSFLCLWVQLAVGCYMTQFTTLRTPPALKSTPFRHVGHVTTPAPLLIINSFVVFSNCIQFLKCLQILDFPYLVFKDRGMSLVFNLWVQEIIVN